jgi:hypothetical protein
MKILTQALLVNDQSSSMSSESISIGIWTLLSRKGQLSSHRQFWNASIDEKAYSMHETN